MGSASSEPPLVSALVRPSLFRRVVVAGAVSAALGGAIAAVTSGLATANLVEEHREEEVLDAARRLAAEVAEEEREDEEPLPAALADELEDVEHVGARGALFDASGALAGDPALARGDPGHCWDVVLDDGPYYACTVSRDGRLLTLAVSSSQALAQKPLFGWAALIGALVGILAGVLLSVRAARWGVAPLWELGRRVREVDSESPRSDVLEPETAHAEIEEVRRALVDLVDRLGVALAHAQRFASDAAHELRTPLTTLAGELELLGEGDEPVDGRDLQRLRDRVRALSILVEQLLVLAIGHGSRADEAVDAGDLALEVGAQLPEDARARVRISSEDDVIVRGDAALLRAALGNAVDNALKFSSDRVDLSVRAVGSEAWIEVRDRGRGLSGGELERAFEPFYRAPSARRAGVDGHGIGLALIAHVATSHGGRAELLDVPEGAHLRIRIPSWRGSDVGASVQ